MARTIFILVLAGLLLGGCASTSELTNDPRDPWEGFNRGVYGFNNAIDTAILKPTAKGYRYITPDFVETGVSNFYANLFDIPIALNNTLQFKFGDAASDLGRFVINSTIGLAGFIDVASKMGLEKHHEDFGQTLGKWGVGTGPYIVLPFLGPANMRDGPGRIVDIFTHPLTWIDIKDNERWIFWGIDIVHLRAELLEVEEKFEDVNYDRYVFLRDAYLDRREFLVNDGEISTDDALYDELEEE